jgi:two-component system, NarL family, response regulator LiaR
MNKKIRVLIVDDHQVVREGFVVFLNAFSDMEYVGQASNGEEAVRLCQELQPNVVLMDMMMPVMNGIAAARIIRQQCPDTRILGLTGYIEDPQIVQEALSAGISGFMSKVVSVAELAQGIRAVWNGQPVLSSEAMGMLIASKTQRTVKDFHLTDREREVLGLMMEGLNNNDIAERLTLSRSTIKFHVSSILGKLGASSRTEAVSIAHQHKLVK